MPRKRKRNTAPAGQQSQPVKAAEAPRNEMRAITVKEGRREYSSELDQALDRMFGAVVANPDKTLDVHAYRHNATGIELYSEMIRKDAQLKLLFDARALTVLSQGWQIEPASSDSEDVKRAEWVEDKFLQIKHFSMSRKLFFGGISHGYRPAEIMLDVVGGEWVVTEFQNREPYRFGFDREDGLILVRREGRMVREVMPDHKFLMNTWGSDETPYGSAMLKNLYSLWFFKNHALKTFFKFLEKFGTPTLVGEYPPGSSTDDQNALLDILYNMIGSSAVIKPEGTKLEIARTEGVSAISGLKMGGRGVR